MGDDEDSLGFVFEALAQMLSDSPAWSKKITDFEQANCSVFEAHGPGVDGESSFVHGEFDIWRQYEEMVETLVDEVLEQLGISRELFTQVCTKHSLAFSRSGATCPKGIQKLLKSIVVCSNFESFSQKMRSVCEERKRDEETHARTAEGGRWVAPFTWLPSESEDRAGGCEGKRAIIESCSKDSNAEIELLCKDWEVQLSLARSFLEAESSKALPDKEKALLPWARIVAELHETLRFAPLSGQRSQREEEKIGRLIENLKQQLPAVKDYVSNSVAGEHSAEQAVEISSEPALLNQADDVWLAGGLDIASAPLGKLIEANDALSSLVKQRRTHCKRYVGSSVRDSSESDAIDQMYLEMCSQLSSHESRSELRRGASRPEKMHVVRGLKREAKKRLGSSFEAVVCRELISLFVSLCVLETRLMLVQKELGDRVTNGDAVAAESKHDDDNGNVSESKEEKASGEHSGEAQFEGLGNQLPVTESARIFRESQGLRRDFMFGRAIANISTSSEFASLIDFMRSADAMPRSSGNITLGVSEMSVLARRTQQFAQCDEDMPS